jgi:hypothetical protein
MNLEEAKEILKQHGKPTCSYKYGGSNENMIAEAVKLKEAQTQQG